MRQLQIIITVNYGHEESLTYITSFKPDTGTEYYDDRWETVGEGFHVAGEYDNHLLLEDLLVFSEMGTHVEGYVLTHFPSETSKYATRVGSRRSGIFAIHRLCFACSVMGW